MSAERQIISEGIQAIQAGSKPQIDLLFRLGIYSLASLICFWFPFVTIFRFKDYAERGGCVLYLIFPFIMFAAMYSIVLLGKLFSSLKKFKSQRRFLIAFFGIVVSLPSLAGGISMIVYLPFFIP